MTPQFGWIRRLSPCSFCAPSHIQRAVVAVCGVEVATRQTEEQVRSNDSSCVGIGTLSGLVRTAISCTVGEHAVVCRAGAYTRSVCLRGRRASEAILRRVSPR